MNNVNINKFLTSFGIGFTNDGLKHYTLMCQLIIEKMFYPDKPECNFITSIVNEEWDKAYWSADTRNKEAIDKLNLYQKFVEFVKESPDFIRKQRNDKLDKLLD